MRRKLSGTSMTFAEAMSASRLDLEVVLSPPCIPISVDLEVPKALAQSPSFLSSLRVPRGRLFLVFS